MARPIMVLVLFAALSAAAQMPPCFRSKYAAEWPIKVKRVDLHDSGSLTSRDKQTIVRELKRQCDCWPCALTDEVSEQVRDMYQWFGYFQAVADVDIHKLGVDSYSVTARVQEGPQYRLSEIAFGNAKAFPTAQLRTLFPIQAGELFDTRKIRQGFEELRRLYGRNGYENFTPVPVTTVDRSANTIALRVDLDEGKVFHYGPLQLGGREPAPGVGKRLLTDWQSIEGKVYDPALLERFVDEHALMLKVHNSDFISQNVQLQHDPKAAIVSVHLNFPTPIPD